MSNLVNSISERKFFFIMILIILYIVFNFFGGGVKTQQLKTELNEMLCALIPGFQNIECHTMSEINKIIEEGIIEYKKNYIHLEDVYQDYINQLISSGYTPYDMIDSTDFVNQMSPYWSNVLEQVIPSTTLWMGGNLIENNIFARPKYAYRKPCKPIEIVENLYPDFE